MDETIVCRWCIACGQAQVVAAVGYDNDGAMVVVDDGEVININTSGGGNAVITAEDGEPFELNNFYGAGELKLDMYIDSSGTAPDGQILIKMTVGTQPWGRLRCLLSISPR